VKKQKDGSINAAIAILAIGTGLILSMRPWRMVHTQEQDTAKHVAEMKAAEAERAELLKEEARARGSVGKETMARALGYVKKGQKPADAP
jgi:hypothetical protein